MRTDAHYQDALVSALEQWPKIGTPANSGAWLMAAAKNRALDELRRRKLHDALAHETPLGFILSLEKFAATFAGSRNPAVPTAAVSSQAPKR